MRVRVAAAAVHRAVAIARVRAALVERTSARGLFSSSSRGLIDRLSRSPTLVDNDGRGNSAASGRLFELSVGEATIVD